MLPLTVDLPSFFFHSSEPERNGKESDEGFEWLTVSTNWFFFFFILLSLSLSWRVGISIEFGFGLKW